MTAATNPRVPKTWSWRRVHRGLAALLIGGGVYLGYCWGWWLRDNLLAQALFPCNCPAASEAVRYAPFRLVASGCADPYVRVSPAGTYLLITERAARPPVTVLVDVTTGSRTVLPDANQTTTFVTDTLLMLRRGPTGIVIVDRGNPTQPPRPLDRYSFWMRVRDRHTEAGTLYVLRDVEEVVFMPSVPDAAGYFVGNGASDATLQAWAAPPERTVVISSAYGRLTATRPTWHASGLGIFDRATQTMVVGTKRQKTPWPLRPWMHSLPFQPVGWLAGDRSEIYQYDAARAFVIDFGSGVPFTGRLGLFDVPQPVLALDVPAEVLRATPPP